MRAEDAPLIRLEDYRVSDWLIDTVDLDIALAPEGTRVRAQLGLRPNPAGRAGAPLALDGEDLRLVGLAIDGAPLAGAPVTWEFTTGADVAPPGRKQVSQEIRHAVPLNALIMRSTSLSTRSGVGSRPVIQL